MRMAALTLRFSVVEKNDRGQEVELVRKALQFKPQVCLENRLFVLCFCEKKQSNVLLDSQYQILICYALKFDPAALIKTTTTQSV